MSVLLQRLKWIIKGFNRSAVMNSKRLDGPDVIPLSETTVPQSKKQLTVKSNGLKPDHEMFKGPLLEAVHEVSIYVHRFHNLDLFQQGWYQLKITIKWEDGDFTSFGTPSRVVQYEAPDLGSDDIYGIWRIDDTDYSFSTQPFRIRYARQDVILAMMVSFNIYPNKIENPPTSSVTLRFELLYSAVLENRLNLLACLDTSPAAVHEFRLPPKTLMGMHVYCPVHFDAFHSVLVDTTVHVSLLKSEIYNSSPKVSSEPKSTEGGINGEHDKSQQAMLVKSLSSARSILLEDLQKISNAINKPIDPEEITPNGLFGPSLKSGRHIADGEVSGHASSVSLGAFEELNGEVDFDEDEFLHLIPENDILKSLDLIGNQVFHLWTTFINYHRANVKKILELLRNQWAADRKAEWSIWMVYTKVEMPHQYISSAVNDSSSHGSRGRGNLRKLSIDPVQTATMRMELHRRSIAQMKMNNSSIQDLQIFGDPSRVPIVVVERVVNVPVRSTSGNSYFSRRDQKDMNASIVGVDSNLSNKLSGTVRQNGCVLKIVVFVHGFQGHHLDLRLIRNQWLLIDPKVEFLMSEVNEDKTSGDFREMGQRLAHEVVSFIKKKMDKVSRTGVLTTIKLSFVGHSIGNIILRTALTDSIMEPYLRYLHTYLSVSGPHLGYLYSSNSLFNGGLWLLKKLKGTQCIHQLTFTDDADLQNTFLYKLCKQKTLEHFKNIVLLSSPQDGYVPYHSARIEMCPASSGDFSKKGKIFLEMLNDCLDQIRAPSSDHRVFMRCDINFDISVQGRSLNTIIGRAAHIEFLEADSFAKFIMWSFPDLFR